MEYLNGKTNLRPEVIVEITSNIDSVKLSLSDSDEKEVNVKGGCTKKPITFKSSMCKGHYCNGVSICLDSEQLEE